jgi:hypothetical protein
MMKDRPALVVVEARKAGGGPGSSDGGDSAGGSGRHGDGGGRDRGRDRAPRAQSRSGGGKDVRPTSPARRSRRRTRAAGADLERARRLADFHAWEEQAQVAGEDKVIEAKVRLSQGHYERDDVRLKILRALLKEILPPPSDRRRTKKRSQPAPDPPGDEPAPPSGETA